MSDNLPDVMRGRGPVTAPVAVERHDVFSAALEVAHELSKAGPDVLPKAYRGNRGAVLLVTEWARHNDVPWLTAMQGVSFVQGRPVIDATLQRALAERAGYRVIVVEASPDHATVAVSRDGEGLGSATFTMADAKRAKLDTKDNWKTYAEDMLVARATSRAVRRYCAGVLVGMATPDEVDLAPEVAAVESAKLEGAVTPSAVETEGSLVPQPSETRPAHPIIVPASEADQLALDDEPGETAAMASGETCHKVQAALSQVDAGQLRAVLDTAVEQAGIDPAHLADPRHYRRLTESQAWKVIDLASQLMLVDGDE